MKCVDKILLIAPSITASYKEWDKLEINLSPYIKTNLYYNMDFTHDIYELVYYMGSEDE